MTSSQAETAPPPPVDLLSGASLFLDFDGTLVDIAPSPDAVEVTPQLKSLLERLRERLDGRLAILTGRSAEDLDRMLDPLTLAVGGHHGLETRNGDDYESVERPASLDRAIAELRPLQDKYPGVLLEEKRLGIALHYRSAPEAEEACRSAAVSVAGRTGLELQPGKMVFELKPAGANKGAALRRLLQAEPFSGSVPVFLGDDLTDEPAFEAAQQLGGAGVLIGERRQTQARYALPSVQAATQWLEAACEAAR